MNTVKRTLKDGFCHGCKTELTYCDGGKEYSHAIGVEYAYGSKERYDGISEFMCPRCRRREGRWTGNVLCDGDVEPRFGGGR